jgi:hypothetical protein
VHEQQTGRQKQASESLVCDERKHMAIFKNVIGTGNKEKKYVHEKV